jgi:predicted lipid-binding transport protein (Tim44 family)
MIEVLILAAVAAFVLSRLYSVLGRRTGAERPDLPARPRQVPDAAARADMSARPMPAPEPTGPAVGGLGDLMRADPSFDAGYFLSGARAAYEMIVQAFARGDRDTLRGLLTPRVFDAYSGAITTRDAAGEKGSELVRLKAAEVVDAELRGDVAKVSVRFEAELAEGAHGLRDTREKWTFERNLRSSDPNWLLAAVAAA